jgi:hypothetical protein
MSKKSIPFLVVSDSSYRQYSSILNILLGFQFANSQDIIGLRLSSLHKSNTLAILFVSLSSELICSSGDTVGNSFIIYSTIFSLYFICSIDLSSCKCEPIDGDQKINVCIHYSYIQHFSN